MLVAHASLLLTREPHALDLWLLLVVRRLPLLLLPRQQLHSLQAISMIFSSSSISFFSSLLVLFAMLAADQVLSIVECTDHSFHQVDVFAV